MNFYSLDLQPYEAAFKIIVDFNPIKMPDLKVRKTKLTHDEIHGNKRKLVNITYPV